MDIQLRSIKPPEQHGYNQMPGNRPKSESLCWIKYICSEKPRLAYWMDRGWWGPGFYSVTELQVPESQARQVFRVEPAAYVSPDLWQRVQGEHSIQDIEKLS